MRYSRLFFLALMLTLSLPALCQPLEPPEICKTADKDDYEAVYACVTGWRWQNGRMQFDPTFGSGDCSGYRGLYYNILYRLGETDRRAQDPQAARQKVMNERVPSCETFARIKEDVTGTPPYWSGCMGFEPGNLKEHMPRCLTTFMQRFRGKGPDFTARQTAGALPSCQKMLDTYEHGLRSSSPGQHEMPEGYERPSCEIVAAIAQEMMKLPESSAVPSWRAVAAALMPVRAAKANPFPGISQDAMSELLALDPEGGVGWADCLGFDPENVKAHMDKCLGPFKAAHTECRGVIDTYEARLMQAYDGRFPQGYVRPPCSVAQEIAQENKQREERQLAAAKQQNEAQKAAREAERRAFNRQINKNPVGTIVGLPAQGQGENFVTAMTRQFLDGILPGDQSDWGLLTMLGWILGGISAFWLFLYIAGKLAMKGIEHVFVEWLRDRKERRRQRRREREAARRNAQGRDTEGAN